VTAPIVGANTVAQLTDVLSGLDRELPDEHIKTLDHVSTFHRSHGSLER
jgi:aryl-alcohol dehydrogenase-like predicted oxidoreductase